MLLFVASIGVAFMALVTHLSPQLTMLELACAAIPVGSVGGAWVFFLGTMLLNFLGQEAVYVAWVSLAFLFLSYLDPFLGQLKAALPHIREERKTLTYFLPLVLTSAAAGFQLYSSRYINEDEDGNVWTGGATWADLPIHLHIANAFVHGRNRVVYFNGMHSPVFAGEAMKYPFLPDFHAAFLVKAGASMRDAMFIPGWLLFVSFVALLFLLNRRVLGSLAGASADRAALLSVLLVLFAGGFSGIATLFDSGFSKIVSGGADPIGDWPGAPGTVVWFGFLAHVMLPQRGATFAYPMVCFVLLATWVAVHNRRTSTVAAFRSILCFAAVCAGSLPLVQAHALMGIAFFVGALFLLDLYRVARNALPTLRRIGFGGILTLTSNDKAALSSNGAALLVWVLAGVLMISEAYPQIAIFQATATAARGFMVPQPIFKGGPVGFVSHWLIALGVTPFLFLATGIVPLVQYFRGSGVPAAGASTDGSVSDASGKARRSNVELQEEAANREELVAMWAGSLLVFLFGNFIKIQPWERDNVKLLYVWLFIASGFVAHHVLALTFPAPAVAPNKGAGRGKRSGSSGPSNPTALALGGLLVLSMVLAGVLSYIRESQNHHVLYGVHEKDVGNWLIENARTEDVIMHDNNHIQASGLIAGRPSLLGYTGWMWTHGYDYHARDHDRNHVLDNINKASDKRTESGLYNWGVKYVVTSNDYSPRPINSTFIDGKVKHMFQSGPFHIYKLAPFDQ